MTYHLTNGQPVVPASNLIRGVGSWGWLGVEVFFVISGFVMGLSMERANYHPRRHLLRFFGKRIIRLTPPYLVTIALIVVLWHAATLVPQFRGGAPDYSPLQLFMNATYLADFFSQPWINPVFWTLALELQFYLLLGLAFPLLSSTHRQTTLVTMVVCLTAPLLWADAWLVFRWLSLFGLGLLTWLYYSRKIGLPETLCLLALALLTNYLVHGAAVCFVATATAAAIVLLKIKHYPALNFLGLISYSLYLLHIPIGGRVMNLMGRLQPGLVLDLLALLLAALASLAAATLLYLLVERPAKKAASSIRLK